MENRHFSILKPLGAAAAVIIVLAGIKATAFLVGPLVVATLFVAVLRPLYQLMLGKKIPLGIATLITIILFVVIIVFVGWIFALAISQIIVVLQEYGPTIVENSQMFNEYVTSLSTTIAESSSETTSMMDSSVITGFLTGLVSALATFISNTVLVFFLFVFTLTGFPMIMKRMHEHFGDKHPLTVKTTSFLDNLARYFILRTLVNVVTGVGITLGCILLGIPNAVVWGLLTFVLSYIPYIGMFIACIPPGIIALSQGGINELAIFIVICLIVNGISEQILSPIVTGKGLSISPALIFISFIFWGWILGSMGYVVAVPMTLLVLFFLSSFEKTAGLAGLFSDIPQ
jgi:predicted PurR-regulated permease PerM